MKDLIEKLNILFNDNGSGDFVNYCKLQNLYYYYTNYDCYEKDGYLINSVDDSVLLKYCLPPKLVIKCLNNFYENYDKRVLENLRKSFIKRRSKLYNRMIVLLNHSSNNYFITLTFNDDYVNDKINTIIQRVSRYLRQFNYYISNVDFGELRGRIHFHCVINLDNYYDYYKLENWKYGFYYIEKIKSNDDYKILSNYINKLCNHTLKNSTKNYRINYCERLKNVL